MSDKIMDGIKCQVNLSLETLMRYQSAVETKEDLKLGDFIDTCVEDAYQGRGIKEPESPFKVEGKVNLGTIDLQEELRKVKEELKMEKWKAEFELLKSRGSFSEHLAEIKEISELLKSTDDRSGTLLRVIGEAIGKGLIEGELLKRNPSRMLSIEARVGESGEVECTQCHQSIAIGETAKVAVCANCGAKYPIKRGVTDKES